MQQTQKITPPNRANELWIGLSKNKRLPILKSDSIRTGAGLKISEQFSRVDNFLIGNDPISGQGLEDFPIAIRAFELKSKMAVNLMAQGKLDAVITGRDTAKEFNLASKGKRRLQAVELLDMDLCRCAFTVAVAQNDPAKKPKDLNGRIVVTEFPEMLKNWANKNRIQFTKIISGDDIQGGIEGFRYFDPSVSVIADLVQSGTSLAQNGWIPLGMKEQDWNDLIQTEGQQFIDLSSQKLKSIPGVVMESSAILTRNSKRLTADKECALSILQQRLFMGAKSYGAIPVKKSKAVAQQEGQKPQKWPMSPLAPSARQVAALGLR